MPKKWEYPPDMNADFLEKEKPLIKFAGLKQIYYNYF
jgi:hypothetical protein